VKAWAAAHHPHYKVFETICDSTERRQDEVRRLAESVDAVVVVGGRESGNTQRLYEIARQSGKPAWHVEHEADLSAIDLNALSGVQTIGITAGASTPNWVIRKVYMALEATVFRRRSRWHKAVHTFLKASLITNLYVSMGAFGLCYAVSRLQRISEVEPFALIAFLYVQSMHILNHLTGGQADRYNEPERARFYQDRWAVLTAVAFASGAAGLVIAWLQGTLPFAILLVMSLLGLSYRLPLFPAGLRFTRFRRIKDIPGSKTLLIAMAWGTVTAVLPPIALGRLYGPVEAFAFFWAAGLVFVRTAFFDILDMQGDRLVGKETIPILLGEKRSLRLLKAISALLIAGLLLFCLAGPGLASGAVMALSPLVMLAILRGYETGSMLPGVRLEFLVESHVVLVGVLALLLEAAGI
jgi:4-hydroxy-3-methylbut-2-enyl diphosphate reductase